MKKQISEQEVFFEDGATVAELAEALKLFDPLLPIKVSSWDYNNQGEYKISSVNKQDESEDDDGNVVPSIVVINWEDDGSS